MSRKKLNSRLFHFTLLLLFALNGTCAFAQLDSIMVELYYVTDSLDATDTTGGFLPRGSKTYRVFADLSQGARLKRIYGNANHPIRFESTETFFNNKADGESFGFNFAKNRLRENTVALDTWLTLGQTTKSTAKQGGVLKQFDANGSFIAGPGVNDGGSAGIPEGLLNNDNPLAGIPLSKADGNDNLPVIPDNPNSFGILNPLNQLDSTIFGSIISGKKFESRNAALFNTGTVGVDTVQNHVLIAQLTTSGEISFEINLEIEVKTATGFKTFKYVARDSVLLQDEMLSPLLTYPPVCGCKDPDYLEFKPGYACNDVNACKQLVVLGCMDRLACNFQPEANLNVPEICCYIGNCNDLNIADVCPQLAINELSAQQVLVYPNPGQDIISVSAGFDPALPVDVTITNSVGALVYKAEKLMPSAGNTLLIQSLHCASGIYLLSMQQKNRIFYAYWIRE